MNKKNEYLNLINETLSKLSSITRFDSFYDMQEDLKYDAVYLNSHLNEDYFPEVIIDENHENLIINKRFMEEIYFSKVDLLGFGISLEKITPFLSENIHIILNNNSEYIGYLLKSKELDKLDKELLKKCNIIILDRNNDIYIEISENPSIILNDIYIEISTHPSIILYASPDTIEYQILTLVPELRDLLC